MNSLRIGPVPRMAGRLTFMRAPEATLDQLGPGSIAVLGVPMEANHGTRSGCRFGPLAMRETSVYFGWHANPQLAQPLDISTRRSFGAGTMHNRLLDLGDVPVDEAGDSNVFQLLTETVCTVTRKGAMPLLLGGDFGMTAPAFEGVHRALQARDGQQSSGLGLLMIGGAMTLHSAGADTLGVASPLQLLERQGLLDYSRAVCVCPSAQVPRQFLQAFRGRGGTVYSMHDIETKGLATVVDAAMCKAGAGDGDIYASVDMSAIASDWHGMVNQPDFGGMNGSQVGQMLAALGGANVAALGVTGLNPSLNPLSVVKTGQRLMVSCLLGFIQTKASQTA